MRRSNNTAYGNSQGKEVKAFSWESTYTSSGNTPLYIPLCDTVTLLPCVTTFCLKQQ